ncbi:MAG: S1C family serine protease [Gemmataceae bacterium]|nr:S1C family serine protease [Gemmataceae bacterium]
MPSVRRYLGWSLLVAVSLLLAPVQAAAESIPGPLPKVFDKAVPESVKDLRDIEQHVKKLLDKIVPATVGLRIGASSGSGVIIDKEGHILTAGHVSGRPDQDVQILLHDGKTRLKGKTLGGKRDIDSGLIKITDKGEFPFVDMAVSADLKKGNWCIAIGHPNGYQPGRPPVVRLGRILEVNPKFLRTDCTLVGGDSGGPLFDMHGKVIGIHSRIGGLITANIHVPVDTYRDTWDKLVAGEIWGDTLFGKKKKPRDEPYLGIRTDPNAKECRVQLVSPDSPAGKAGLMPEDVIVGIDGKKVGTPNDYDNVLRTKRPGNTIALEIRRGAKLLNLTVTLSKRPG